MVEMITGVAIFFLGMFIGAGLYGAGMRANDK